MLLGERRYLLVLIVLAVLWTTAFSYLAVVRHKAFYSNLWDLGWTEQWVWNTSRGRVFRTSIRGDPQGSFLAEHMTLIPILVAPLYRFLPRTETLLVFQSVALVLGLLPLYFLARYVFQNRLAAFLLALGYLVCPLPINIALFDFHPIAFVVPILMALFLSIARGNNGAALALGFLALLIQEEVALTLFMVGLTAWWWRKRKLGISITILSVVWFLGTLISNLTSFPHGPLPRLFGYRYSLSLAPHLKFILLKWRYLFGTLGMFVFLPLLGGVAFIAAIPALTYNLLSIFGPQLGWDCQYTAVLVTPLFVGSVFGIRRGAHVLGRIKKISLQKPEIFLSSWLLVTLLLSTLVLSSGKILGLIQTARVVSNSAKLRYQALQLIPPQASVATGNSLGAHLARREELYDFPRFPFKADWVIFDTKWRVDQGFEGVEFYQSQVDRLKRHPDYRLIADFNGVVVYKYGL
jgi:uncharacterized membrane protein